MLGSIILRPIPNILNWAISIAPPANSYAIAGPLNGMDKRMWIAQCVSNNPPRLHRIELSFH